MRAWVMDNDVEGDQRLPHQQSPNKEVSNDQLRELGVDYWTIKGESDPLLASIREQYGYSYHDVISISRELMGADYEPKIKQFFTEHIHDDDEIRLVLEGTGYFDVRNKDDQWIRIEMQPSDMISLPAGIYHRFTLDQKDYIKVMRLFIGQPVWTALNRKLDEKEKTRTQYEEKYYK